MRFRILPSHMFPCGPKTWIHVLGPSLYMAVIVRGLPYLRVTVHYDQSMNHNEYEQEILNDSEKSCYQQFLPMEILFFGDWNN